MGSFRKKLFGAGLVPILGLLFAWSALNTGCAPAPKSTAPITLRFSTWGSAEEMAILKTQLAKFEARHPQIRVSVIHAPENYFQKLHILVAGGLTPDVMMVNSFDYPVYAHYGVLAPLDLPIKDYQLAPVFYRAPLQAFQYKEHLYALPRDVSVLAVFVNTDLFKKAGVPVPRPNWTLADLAQIAPKLTRDTNHDGQPEQFGLSFSSKPPLTWLPYVWSQGGALFHVDLRHIRLGEPHAVEALQPTPT